ncbi:MAG: hypothetical protein IPM64_15805 [Phycisphaerales bacterium]|nr:hypothetical protein [Phycisphaerales bacterium]
MLRLIGIDEAGYGPVLGPLVVAATVWDIGEPQAATSKSGEAGAAPDVSTASGSAAAAIGPPDLWQRLSACVCRSARGAAGRLIVGDSKEVFDRKRGVGTLERSVRAFAAAGGAPVDRLAALLRHITDRGSESGTRMPWYRALDRALPADGVLGGIGEMGRRLGEELQQARIGFRGARVEIVAEDRYNDRVAATRNKSTVVVEQVLRLIERGIGEWEGPVCVVVDRLGGRSNYRTILQDAWPDRAISETEATAERSAYQLAPRGGARSSTWSIEFRVGADEHHLPVALASMTAKYIRELLMGAFNEFWSARLPGLRPTAGYYTDAQRFLADIAPCCMEMGIPHDRFVRAR